jgi:hypothetical protein
MPGALLLAPAPTGGGLRMKRLVSWLLMPTLLLVLGAVGCAGDTKSKGAGGSSDKAIAPKERQDKGTVTETFPIPK